MTKNITRRAFMLAAGAAAAAAIPVVGAKEAQKRTWPDQPDVPTDFQAERCFVELAEKGEGVVFEGPKDGPVVRLAFDTQCPWCKWQFEQLKPFLGRATFIWHPVAVLNPWSEPQGAAILAAQDGPQGLSGRARRSARSMPPGGAGRPDDGTRKAPPPTSGRRGFSVQTFSLGMRG